MKYEQQSIGREKAIALSESKWWEGISSREIAEFQMLTEELCLPFSVFHKAIEETLGRPVFTHEFSSLGFDGLIAELFDGAAPRTFDEVMDLIPAAKRIIVTVSPSSSETFSIIRRAVVPTGKTILAFPSNPYGHCSICWGTASGAFHWIERTPGGGGIPICPKCVAWEGALSEFKAATNPSNTSA